MEAVLLELSMEALGFTVADEVGKGWRADGTP